ncbi:MAG: PilZ domain-containing protein [Deltaproteobacteria bacterium]|nr:PilZ domain-containing protein [Deltaproteobacteria bacterium]MBK8719067.1 PilZ domain-containing protein [Deltaproteobacteria bacterium]MBP7287982.1 PilZ domain-containing protein [Nannocystaceae bacterium]
MTSFDRRQQPRIDWAGDAVAAWSGHELRLRALDLSIGGVAVETNWQAQLGERLGLVLHLDGEPLGTWAEVAWTAGNDERWTWGLRFVELEPQSQQRLASFVDRCLAVDMLDALYEAAQQRDRPVPDLSRLGAVAQFGELDDVPTQIFGPELAAQAAATFPLEPQPPDRSDATAEMDMGATLVDAKEPHGDTVRVHMDEIFAAARAAGVTSDALANAAVEFPTHAHAPFDPAQGGELEDPYQHYVQDDRANRVEADAWPRFPVHLEPLEVESIAREPCGAPLTIGAFTLAGAAALPVDAIAEDPFLARAVSKPAVEVMAPQAVVPPRRPTPAPAHLMSAPVFGGPAAGIDPDEGVSDAPFVAAVATVDAVPNLPMPPDDDALELDAGAFDPTALLGPASVGVPVAAPRGPDEIAAPVAPAAGPGTIAASLPIEPPPPPGESLLDMKRRRVEELLKSVKRRPVNTASDADADANASKRDTGKRRVLRTLPVADADTGLKRLYDDALRDVNRDE